MIRVGYIHNKRSNQGGKGDVLRLQIINGVSGETVVDVCIRLDEAIAIAAGLTRVATMMTIGWLKVPRETLRWMKERWKRA